MSYFAKVQNNTVLNVIKAEKSFVDSYKDGIPGEWIQTSFNTRGGIHYGQDGKPSKDQSKALRKNYAGRGFIYDRERDAFYEPQPYPSWTLDEASCLWEPPVPRPDDPTKMYEWNEAARKWDEGTFEELQPEGSKPEGA